MYIVEMGMDENIGYFQRAGPALMYCGKLFAALLSM